MHLPHILNFLPLLFLLVEQTYPIKIITDVTTDINMDYSTGNVPSPPLAVHPQQMYPATEYPQENLPPYPLQLPGGYPPQQCAGYPSERYPTPYLPKTYPPWQTSLFPQYLHTI